MENVRAASVPGELFGNPQFLQMVRELDNAKYTAARMAISSKWGAIVQALLDRDFPERRPQSAKLKAPKPNPQAINGGKAAKLNGGGDHAGDEAPEPSAPRKPAFAAEVAREYHEQRVREESKEQEKQEAAEGQAKQKAADILIRLAKDGCEQFHSQDGRAFAYIAVGDHHETWPITSKAFKRWLAHQFFLEAKGAPGSEAMQAALNVISAIATFEGERHEVYLRVAEFDGKLYLDLADDKWRVVEISSQGWSVIETAPIRFRRTPGMLPLPEPQRGGKITELSPLLNLPPVAKGGDDNAFILIVGVLLNGLRAGRPQPVLSLAGEHGSSKSTMTTLVRSLLDPSTAPLRTLPDGDRDLFVAASNGYVQAFDNLSGIPRAVSDTLCRLSSGGGFGARELYTDMDEVLFSGTRLIILNGIEDIVTRPDLADRCVFVTLPSIPPDKRCPENELRRKFDECRPRVLGALLDGAVRGLKKLPTTRLDRLPRMADFAVWATACETAFYRPGAFMAAYLAELDDAVQLMLESDPVALELMRFMEPRADEWKGTATDLLTALTNAANMSDVMVAKRRSWPKEAHHLSGRLRRMAPNLRKVGLDVEFDIREGHARTRMMCVRKIPVPKVTPKSASAASAAPETGKNGQDNNGLDAVADFVNSASAERPHALERRQGVGAADAVADAGGRSEDAASVRFNHMKNKDKNAADAADAKSPNSLGRAEYLGPPGDDPDDLIDPRLR
jgi:hypothetical protein